MALLKLILKNYKKGLFKRKAFFVFVCLITTSFQSSNNIVYLEMEAMTLANGKYSKVVSELLFNKQNGDLITKYLYPNVSYWFTNEIGQAKIYEPSQNVVQVKYNQFFSTKGSLFYIFLKNKAFDLGFKSQGFQLTETTFENEFMVTQWIPSTALLNTFAEVKLVLKNNLPIYTEYLDHNQLVIQKFYYSEYENILGINFPKRITEISYSNEGLDSTISRVTFKILPTNTSRYTQLSTFKIPDDAKVVD